MTRIAEYIIICGIHAEYIITYGCVITAAGLQRKLLVSEGLRIFKRDGRTDVWKFFPMSYRTQRLL